jgi:RNA polymerase sigma factor (sigma-70 family)
VAGPAAEGERELVRRANAGDGDALVALYRAERDWVVGLAQRFTGSREDALDVLQETFLYFFSRFPGFVLTSSVRGFLYPVVKHHAIDVVRRRRKVVDLDAYRRDPQGEAELGWHAPDADARRRRSGPPGGGAAGRAARGGPPALRARLLARRGRHRAGGAGRHREVAAPQRATRVARSRCGRMNLSGRCRAT